MLELKDWIQKSRFADKPWLVLGKGPSFSRRSEFKLDDYNTLAINHVVREQKVNIAHMNDIDVVEACRNELLTNCDWLIMPAVPNVKCSPSQYMTMQDWLQCLPVLSELDRLGKLVVYNFSHLPDGDAWTIDAQYFSSESALGILGRMAVKTVRSLGVDGGRNYSGTFADLSQDTLLVNGQPSFDLQFERLDAIAARYEIDYAPLIKPMLIYVGMDESQVVATKVLEYSIHKYATRPARVIPMLNLPYKLPKDKKNLPRTGFSFHRFTIPALCNYSDRALYLDADMQVFSDIAELWDIPFNQQRVLCTYQKLPEAWKNHAPAHEGRQYSVMLLDCPRLNWKIEEIIDGLNTGKFTYENLMFELCLVKPDEIEDRIPPEWNCLEHYTEGVSKLVHYTMIDTQPWAQVGNPLENVWMNGFREAYKAGYVTDDMVADGIDKGHLRPLLMDIIGELKAHSDMQSGTPRGECTTNSSLSPAAKIQLMEQEIRDLQAQIRSSAKQLQCSNKELNITAQRLACAKDEIEEYKNQVLGLERSVHNLYRSTTWKLGRLFTKPVALARGSTKSE